MTLRELEEEPRAPGRSNGSWRQLEEPPAANCRPAERNYAVCKLASNP